MNNYTENDAVISEDGKYRYLLRRVWDNAKPRALLIMLNPSTADARKDDATIRSCVRLLTGLGYGSMEVVNLMAWRATKPADIPNQPSLAMGPDNPRVVEAAVHRCDIAICAWGAHAYADRFVRGVLDIISLYRPAVYCFGKTKAGAPKHPLYIKSGTALEIFGASALLSQQPEAHSPQSETEAKSQAPTPADGEGWPEPTDAQRQIAQFLNLHPDWVRHPWPMATINRLVNLRQENEDLFLQECDRLGGGGKFDEQAPNALTKQGGKTK